MGKNSIQRYLSKIGRKGGLKSRRKLDSETAARMVRVREARRAFRAFYSQCFWSCDPNYLVTEEDISWVAGELMKNGNQELWQKGKKLCR